MQIMVRIGDNLKRIRVSKALTQVEVAERAGISPSTVVLVERNQSEPHMSTVRKLAKALGVEPSELVAS